jgi:phosphoribosylaminoimidazole-succinocarboxamide synthase
MFDGEIILIDEIHTPDSSRYFYKDTYAELQDADQPQRQLSKEFVRQWLISEGFQGKEGQTIPEMTPEKVASISERYIELYEKITGETFEKSQTDDIAGRIKQNVLNYLG